MKSLCNRVFLLCCLGSSISGMAQNDPQILRGAMVAPTVTAQDLRDLAALGANHIRWQLTWGGFPKSPADTAPPEQYLAWVRRAIWQAKALMPLCDSLGLHVLIDLHTLPGGQALNKRTYLGHQLFRSASWQAMFRQCWVEIPIAFRHEPAVWGYDLANEPDDFSTGTSTLRWSSLYPSIAIQVRALDRHKTIIVEGSPNARVEGLLQLQPIPKAGPVVYSLHLYTPNLFTHQGLYQYPPNVSYPGRIDGVFWDSAQLRKTLQPARDWQLQHHTDIYVGEFSAIRWAPDNSAYRYLRDCIALFEEWGWSWAYHAWREWDGWSVEHSTDRNQSLPEPQPTDRLLLLQKAFRKNAP
ncbi:MAG: hypothetical protein EOP52_07625 [Sphingobacteriales bacterium]|nr:MAG: hypothetical protein EOP52_07625 [Sphingobacteriales bacterium]